MFRTILVPAIGSDTDVVVFEPALAAARRAARPSRFTCHTPRSRVVAALHNVLRELKQESERRSDAAQRHVRDFCKRHKIAMLDMPGRCGHMCRAIPQEDLRAS